MSAEKKREMIELVRRSPQPKRATIYWLLSTWNPYTVIVMQSTLELQE